MNKNNYIKKKCKINKYFNKYIKIITLHQNQRYNYTRKECNIVDTPITNIHVYIPTHTFDYKNR